MNNVSNKQQSEKELLYKTIFDSVLDGLIINDLETGNVIEANPSAFKMHGYSCEEFINSKLLTFIHPDSHPEFGESIRFLQSDGEFNPRLLHIRKDGSTFFAEWNGTVINYLDRPCLLGVVRDVSKRIRAERLLRQRVETHTHEQAKLLQISHTLASTMELQPGSILDQLHEIINFSNGGLFALEDSTLVSLAIRGSKQLESSAPFRILVLTPESLKVLYNEHRPIRIADISSGSSEGQFIRSILVDGASALLEGMQSCMWIPLAVKGRIIGGIGIAESGKNYFTSHHADLALSVANQAAITMINAELYEQAKALAVLEERQSLARNLHDAVNQSLFSAGLIAEVLPRLWARDQEDAQRSLEDLRRLTRGAQAEMRALLAELRPSTITDSNLGDLLLLLGNALSGKTNIPVDVVVTDEYSYPPDVQIAFYRICQEALSNIAKHAKASQVTINLIQGTPVVEMHISDNGKGFDLTKSISGHYGLGMMRERAEAVGALLSVQSQPGNGTKLLLSWKKIHSKEAL